MFRLHYCWLTYCIKMCDELWFLSLAFGSDVRLVFDQMTQRRETKQKRLSEPQQTCGGAVDAFITADTHTHTHARTDQHSPEFDEA